ncbi:MAG: serine--tRNA ligase, partial [Oscillospiraceae bacterium]
MIDIKLIRTEPEEVKQRIRKRELNLDSTIDEILSLDEERRALTAEVDSMKAEQNAASKQIPAMKKAGEDTASLMAKMKQLAENVKEREAKLTALEDAQKDRMLQLPNLPDQDVVAGGKENNKTLRTYLEKPKFDFEIKNHVDLCESLGIIDYKRGVKLSGNGAWLYRGEGTRLEWALLNFFIAEHL